MKLTKSRVTSFRKFVGSLIMFSQVFSLLAPLATFAAPQSTQGSDIQNSLETVGTKANRLKTVGNSGVDESTGAFTYSYPFALPKGLMGLEPSITLAYNSQATENSTIGYGWNLAIPYIERTAKYGVDRIYIKNDFVSSLGGELTQKSGTTNQYIQKIDDGSYQLYTLNNNIFTLTDRSGNIYNYGTTVDSRLSDDTGTKIQKYYLTEVKGILGNKIKYFYEKKNNFVYPKEIVYTVKKDGTYSNKITFEREDRADKEVSYKSGFRTEMSDRIKAIHAFTDNIEVAKLELAYSLGQNGNRSLLSNIKESRVGTDGLWSTIPDTKFDYEKELNISFQPGASTVYYTNNPNFYPNQAFVDVTGDGKIDLTDARTSYLYSSPNYTFMDVNGDYYTDKLADNYYRFDNGNFVSLSKSAYGIPDGKVMDVNSDGLQDVLGSQVYLNLGEQFVNSSSSLPTGILNYGDFNGDGLIDIVKEYASSTNASTSGKYVYLNNGNGWNTNPELLFKYPEFNKQIGNCGQEVDGGVYIGDVNADGLDDVVRSYFSEQWQDNYLSYCLAPINNQRDVYINTGASFLKVTNINLNNYFSEYKTGNYYVNGFYPPREELSYFRTMWDANGDGSMDIAGGVSNAKRQDILKQVTSTLGAKSEVFYTGSVNQNNPKLPINILTVSEIKNTEVNKNLVDSIKYKYENGKMYYDKNNVYDRRFAGFAQVTIETNTGTGATPNIKRVVKYFHQGDGDDAATYERGDSFHNIGRVYKEEVYGVVNNVATKYAETYRTYGVYNWDGQIYKYPKLEVSTEYDKQGNVFSKASAFDYDLAARLPKQTENFGEVKWDIITGTFADVGEDYVLTKNIYNTKRPQKLLAEESTDINGKFLDKKLYFYDELPFGYVEKGLLSEERNYSNANNYVKTVYTYNNNGQVATKTENNGAVISYSYDANFNPITVTNALGQSVNATYNKANGQKIGETDANGKVTNTVYDGYGNVKSVSQTSSKDDTVKLVATKSISYSINGMTETESVYNNGAIYKTSVKNYDSFGRLIKSDINNTENSNQTIDVVYNNLGQMVSVSYPYDANGILAGYFAGNNTNYYYDELGRNISVSQGDPTNYTDYLVNGKVTRDNTIDQHKKEYKYNSLGKLSNVKEYTSTSNFTETKYDWNLLGNLTKLTDALGNIRNFTYDSEGRLLKQEDLHNATDSTFATYTYVYDTNGLLTSKKDPSNNVATYEYDILNRPKKESFGVVTNYNYDTCQNGVGALCSVTNSEYTQNLKYNKNGNTVSEVKIINDTATSSKSFENKYEYNDLGQNTKIILPDASTIAYTYDTSGKQKTASVTRMINVNGSQVASTTNIVTDAKYNIDGTIKNITSGNNVKTCYEYSGINGGSVLPRLSKINVTSASDCNSVTASNLLFIQELKYNLFGSIIENKEIFGPNNFNSGISNEVNNKYTYDVLQRLTKNERLENNLTVVNNLSYNSIGNILSSDTTNYTYSGSDYQNPHAPSVIGNVSMSYDLNGNVLGDNKNKYEWNLKNTLKKVANDKSVTAYTYDVSGERIKEVTKVKSNISTSTFAVNNEINNLVGSSTAQTLLKDLPYVSEATFNELNVNKLASQNKVEALFAIAIEANKYTKDTCKKIANLSDVYCQKKEAIKFVAAYLFTKHNIKLSNVTLDEMYEVYIGNLKMSKSVDTYDKQNNQYKKIINVATTSIVSTTTLNTLVFGIPATTTLDKNLLGYVYKQKKLASLFGSDKLISKESFSEISQLGFTYSDLVVKDMLIDASFAPYTSCDSILDVNNKRNCQKEIFVKYLFAIIKYETDRELSNVALDELFEVTEGNMSIPNNTDEYYLYDIKKIVGTNFANNTLIFAQGLQTTLGTAGNCNVGYYNGNYYGSGMTAYSSCMPTFTLPQEVKDRAGDLYKVEIESLNIPKSLTDLKIYLNVSQPSTFFTPTLTDFYKGVNNDYSMSIPNYVENSNLNVDITGIIKSWAQDKVSGNGLRFTSNAGISFAVNQGPSSLDQLGYPVSGVSTLKYTFRTDAQQNFRMFYTPYVINPKDTNIYNNVLQVLARIDKDYKAGPNTIISAETYSEIKNMYATSTEKLFKLFDENEKLQRDDTLSAVWGKLKTDYNQEITREALEEIYLVWTGVTALPQEEAQYNWRVATTTQVLASVGTSTIKNYLKILSTTPVTVSGVNYLNVNVEPNFSVFDRNSLTNLSVVPNVFSIRTLSDTDIINTKMYVATSSKIELKTAGIEKRNDILQFTTTIAGFGATSTISRVNKIDNLIKINSEIKRIKNVNLSREALEEIYYILNIKLIINNLDLPAGTPQEISGLLSKYKLNGVVGSASKKTDEMRFDKPIYVETGTTVANGRGDTTGVGAYQLSGGYIRLPQTVPALTNEARTFSVWFKTSNGGFMALMGFGAKGSRNMFSLNLNNGKMHTEPAWVSGGNVGYGGEGVGIYNNGLWHKADITIENSPNSKTIIYVDGVKDSEFNYTSPHNFSSLSNEINLGAMENWSNMTMSSNFTGTIDEFKIYNKALTPGEIQTAYQNDIGNVAAISENLDIFSRSTFKLLEPIAGVKSEFETSQTDNITYNIGTNDIKLVSEETRAELSLVNITSRQQILDIMNQTKTIYKDSKISYLSNYIKSVFNYELSREALEEIYLIYSEKEIFLPGQDIAKVITTTTTVTSPTPCDAGLTSTGSANAFSQSKSYCDLQIIYPNKYGYNVRNVKLNYAYANSNIEITVNGIKVAENPSSGTINLTPYAIGGANYMVRISGVNTNTFTTYLNPISNLNIITTYELANQVIDRNTFGDLNLISPLTKLQSTYQKEIEDINFGNSTTSTTTIVKLISPETKLELNQSATLTDSYIKSLFTALPTTYSTSTKKYAVYLKLKNDLNLDLSRLALEELFNVSLGKVTLATSTPNTTNTTITQKLLIANKMTDVQTFFYNAPYGPDAGYCNIIGYIESECHLKFGGFTKPSPDHVLTSAKMTTQYWSNTTGNFDIYIGLPTENYLIPSKHKVPVDISDNIKITTLSATGVQAPVIIDVTTLVNKSLNNPVKTDFDLSFKKKDSINNSQQSLHMSIPYEGWGGVYGLKAPEVELIWSKSVPVAPTNVNNRNDYLDTVQAYPYSELLNIYNTQLNLNTSTSSATSTTATTTLPLIPTLNSTSTPVTPTINISTTTLALLNPLNYPYSVTSSTSINLQINGIIYEVTLQNYVQFYIDLEANNINTLAKYLNKISYLTETESYTKYYPSPYYEYDTRGYITINVPFNNKVVATIKYSTGTSNTATDNLVETSFLHSNYLATPVLITDSNASTTAVIKSDVWGVQIANQLDTTQQTKTNFGLTGHKISYENDLIYAHARYESPVNKIWLSHDPYSVENFSDQKWLLNPSLQNSYSYSTQDPVNKIDPDGKLTIIVPGTWYGNDWTTTNNALFLNSMKSFNEIPVVMNSQSTWSGGNVARDRDFASSYLASMINMHKFEKDEKLNIVAHSHGGNVAKEAISKMNNGIRVDNFVTLGTPVRPDYKTDMSRVNNMVEVYSNIDWTQMSGGNSVGLTSVPGYVANRGRTPFILGFQNFFEMGGAGRYENKSNSVDVTSQTSLSPGLSTAHGQLWSVSSVWTTSVNGPNINRLK